MLRVMWIAAALACGGGKSPPPARPVEPAPVVIVSGSGGGSGEAADAAPLHKDLPRLAERSLTMYEDVAKALEISREDCKAATSRLGQLTASYRDVVIANARVLREGRAKELRAALAPHGEAFDRSAKAIMQSPTMSKCAQNSAFSKAFDELVGAPP